MSPQSGDRDEEDVDLGADVVVVVVGGDNIDGDDYDDHYKLPANATQLSPQSGDRDEEDGVDAGDVVVVVNDRDGDDDGVDLVAVVVVVVDGDDDGGKIFPGGLEKTCPSVKTHAIFHFPPPTNNN